MDTLGVNRISMQHWSSWWRRETMGRAADVCQVCASAVESEWWGFALEWNSPPVLRAAIEIGNCSSFEIALAWTAVEKVRRAYQVFDTYRRYPQALPGLPSPADVYAEAESILRCGEDADIDWREFSRLTWLLIQEDRSVGNQEPIITTRDIMAGALDAVSP